MKIVGRYIIGNNDKVLLVAMQVAITSPNCIALPLIVCSTLCEQSNINSLYDSQLECFGDSKTMIFIYSIGWHILYWSMGISRLTLLKTASNDIEDFNYNPISIYRNFNVMAAYGFFQEVALSPTILATLMGLSIGLLDPIKNGLFLDPKSFLSPLGGAIKTVGEPVVCLNCLIMAGSLGSVKLKFHKNNSSRSSNSNNNNSNNSNNSNSNSNSKDYEVINVIHSENTNDLKIQEIENTNSYKEEDKININEETTNPNFRSIIGFLLCRLVLPSMIMIPILQGFRNVGFIPKERKMMFLVICIISSSPSAQMIVICLNQLGLPDIASKMSFLFLIQYSFSIITITAWTTVAISIFY